MQPVLITRTPKWICRVCLTENFCQPAFPVRHADNPNKTSEEHCQTCAARYKFSWQEMKVPEGHRIMAEKIADTHAEMLYLLRVNKEGIPLYLVIRELQKIEKDGSVDTSGLEWMYAETTCPTNFLGVVNVSFYGDLDPHGVFKFVRAVTVKQALEISGVTRMQFFGCNNEEFLDKVFPELGDSEVTQHELPTD